MLLRVGPYLGCFCEEMYVQSLVNHRECISVARRPSNFEFKDNYHSHIF